MKKTKSYKTLTAIVGLAIILSIPFAVQAGAFRGGMGHGKGFDMMGLKTILELDLSDSQESALLGIITNHQAKRENLSDRLREARGNLRILMEADEINEIDIRQAYRKVSSIREELIVLKARMKTEMRNLLSPEQKSLLEQIKAERRAKWEERVRARFLNLDE